MEELRSDASEESTACFNCGSTDLEKTRRHQAFQYGGGEPALQLSAEVPVYTCRSCGFEFAGSEAEEARNEAVCRHLGLLTPREVARVRACAGMTQAQFAECIRVGIASLKRWESGAIIQNAANDQLIYLMTFPDNIQRLRERNHFEPLMDSIQSDGPEHRKRHRSTHRFSGRCIGSGSLLVESASRWSLRL